ncbi:MAG: YraN family protein, partial [Dermabacter sp.]|nr:YraN family protein [Dermabacter sp.]
MTITTEVDTRGADTLSTKKLGNLGEDIAADILTRAGYEILERNFRTRHGEIDIVALDGTRRERADGLSLAQTIAGLKDEYDVVVMA